MTIEGILKSAIKDIISELEELQGIAYKAIEEVEGQELSGQSEGLFEALNSIDSKLVDLIV